MSLAWPRFFDPSVRLPLGAQIALHWSANLRMLRSPRACIAFVAIAIIPTAVFAICSSFFEQILTGRDAATGTGVFIVLGCAVAVWLVTQHVAFVIAMERTYGPFVRTELRARGTSVCLHCGHLIDASGMIPSHDVRSCPECGRTD